MDQENVVHIHNEVLFSHRNNVMWFEGTWMQLEDKKSNPLVNQALKDKGHVSSHMWKIDPKDKHTQKQT
jgi:hypothetical protein